jgi:hypothetical protein
LCRQAGLVDLTIRLLASGNDLLVRQFCRSRRLALGSSDVGDSVVQSGLDSLFDCECHQRGRDRNQGAGDVPPSALRARMVSRPRGFLPIDRDLVLKRLDATTRRLGRSR